MRRMSERRHCDFEQSMLLWRSTGSLGIGGKGSMKADLTGWLEEPPVTGRYALVGAIAAVAVPTIFRFAVSGSVTGCEFTPYLPFVLLAAILLGWWQAVALAFASVAVLGGCSPAPRQRSCRRTASCRELSYSSRHPPLWSASRF